MDEMRSPHRLQLTKIWHYLSYITVEPTMVLYMMAFMTTSVVEQAFYVYKACTVNHGYNATVCENINDVKYEDILKEVQVKQLVNFFCSHFFRSNLI